ncbi:MAG: PepSY-associated TM helix domain-containing protein [Planctomycetota bacterium]
MARRTTTKLWNKWSRTLHRWGSIAIALPLLLVIASGVLLQVKKQSDWVQPPTARGSSPNPEISFDAILAAARTVEEAGIATWEDVDRLDVRPGKGIVKVRANSRWEVQIDTATGEVLQSAYRRSDLIESLHDGAFFGDWAKLAVFLPSGLVLLALWLTGIYLWWLPIGARRRGRRTRAARGVPPAS